MLRWLNRWFDRGFDRVYDAAEKRLRKLVGREHMQLSKIKFPHLVDSLEKGLDRREFCRAYGLQPTDKDLSRMHTVQDVIDYVERNASRG